MLSSSYEQGERVSVCEMRENRMPDQLKIPTLKRRLFAFMQTIVVLGIVGAFLYSEFSRAKGRSVAGSDKINSYSQSEIIRQAVTDLAGGSRGVSIVVFVASWCPHCRALEAELTQRGVPFTRADIEADWRAGRYFERLSSASGGGIPLSIVGDTLIAGEDVDGILSAIARQSKTSGEVT